MPLHLAKTSGLRIAEVGVGDLFTCKSRAFWDDPTNQVTLYEPNRFLQTSLRQAIEGRANVTLRTHAVTSKIGLRWLVSAGVLSYLSDVESPINTIFRGKLTPMLDAFKMPVYGLPFDTFDAAGDLDLLILGMEGGEAAVFETMVSRPHVIILNNHFANDYHYVFPRFEVIQRWCAANGYQICPGIPDITLVNMRSLQTGALVSTPDL